MAFYKLIKLDPQIAVPCWQRVILFLIAIFIGVLGTIFQVDFQDRLYRYRKRLVKEVLPQLSGKLEESELRDTDKAKYVSRWNGFVKFTLPFILMLWIGVLIVFWCLLHLKVMCFIYVNLNGLAYETLGNESASCIIPAFTYIDLIYLSLSPSAS